MRASRFFLFLITAAALPILGQGESDAASPEALLAFSAVAKAWSLPADASGATQVWAGARPEDLASAALLWKNAGPVSSEGWRLRQAEKSWESVARKAGAPVDALLKEYRSLLSDQTRNTLAQIGEEWAVLAEIRTLERLTGRGAKAVASLLVSSDFRTLLLAALPVAGPPASPQRPSASPAPSAPNQWQASDPMAPIPAGTAPTNKGMIGTGGPPRSR